MDTVKDLEDAILRAWKGKGRSMFKFNTDGQIDVKVGDFDLSVYSPRLDAQFTKKLQKLDFKIKQERKRERSRNRFRGI